jgi:hypothetical protein
MGRALIAFALVIAVFGPSVSSVGAAEDWPIAGGHFFTQTGGGTGKGYSVTDDKGIPFYTHFLDLGGVAGVGYPASQRFAWDGYICQVFQKVIFQWDPVTQTVHFVNVYDLFDQLGFNDWLLNDRQTPPPKQWDEAGLSWDQIVASRMAVMDAYPAIKAAYDSALGDPIEAHGLPTTDVVDMGNHYALRAQRTLFQLWKEDVPWAQAGTVTLGLGGDIAKEGGILPEPGALEPVDPAIAGRPLP